MLEPCGLLTGGEPMTARKTKESMDLPSFVDRVLAGDAPYRMFEKCRRYCPGSSSTANSSASPIIDAAPVPSSS